jgi:hypothetical protein
MPHTPTPGEAGQSGGVPDATGDTLIHVPASAQQESRAIHMCPVCGQPYAFGSQPVGSQEGEATSQARVVFRCSWCKTYSVGVLERADEDAGG